MTIQTTRSIASVREEMSAEFKRTGVIWLRAASTVVFPYRRKSNIDSTARSLLRAEAKQLRRPFIHASSEWYTALGDEGAERLITTLTIPNLAKLRTITMGLYLVSVENKESWTRWNTDDPVSHWGGNSNHCFQFVGEVGHRIFEDFLDQCVNDPVWRIVLGNAPPVTPKVIPLAA